MLFFFREDHVALAVLRLLEYEKVILEASGAVGLAALIGGYLPELKGKRYKIKYYVFVTLPCRISVI